MVVLPVCGHPCFILARKLKALKDLKKWNVEVFGNVEVLFEELQRLEGREEIGALMDKEISLKTLIASELRKCFRWRGFLGGRKLGLLGSRKGKSAPIISIGWPIPVGGRMPLRCFTWTVRF